MTLSTVATGITIPGNGYCTLSQAHCSTSEPRGDNRRHAGPHRIRSRTAWELIQRMPAVRTGRCGLSVLRAS